MDSKLERGTRPNGDGAGAHETQRWHMPAREGSRLRASIHRSTAFIVRRRHALALVLGILILADFTIVIAWPSTYRATAKVAVEPASLPDNVAPLAPAASKRVSRIVSQVLSDKSLNDIIADVRAKVVDPSFTRTLLEPEPTSRVQRLREMIAVNVEGGASGFPIIDVTVTGESKNDVPKIAQRLAEKLVELDTDFRHAMANDILGAEKAASVVNEAPLRQKEQELERFRKESPQVAIADDATIRAHAAELESKALEDQVAQAELEATLPMLRSDADRRREAVEGEVEIARRAAAAAAAEQQGIAARGGSQDDPRRAYLSELERELFRLRARYTDQNPDVKRKVAEIEKERERLGEESLEGGSPAPSGDLSSPAPPPASSGRDDRKDSKDGTPRPEEPRKQEPPRDDRRDEKSGENHRVGSVPSRDHSGIRLVADKPDEGTLHAPAGDARLVLQAPSYVSWREAEAKYEGARSRLEGLKARIKLREPDRKQLAELVKTLPAKRLEFSQLVAERDRLAREKEAAESRLGRTQRAHAIEIGDGRDGSAKPERLVIVEGVLGPEDPLGPDRPFAFVICVLASVLVALGVAYVRDVRDGSIHTGEEAGNALALPVLGVIPRLRGRR